MREVIAQAGAEAGRGHGGRGARAFCARVVGRPCRPWHGLGPWTRRVPNVAWEFFARAVHWIDQQGEGEPKDTLGRARVQALEGGCDMGMPMSCHQRQVSEGGGVMDGTDVRGAEGGVRE